MQLSIFGVPFKCTKDMFTWEKIRTTIFIDWAILWRYYIVSILLGIVFYPILGLLEKDLGVNYFSALFVYLVISCLMYYYSKYSVLYQVAFRTFARKFIKEPDSRKFFSGYFWKPVLISMVFALLLVFGLVVVGAGLWFVLPKNQIGSQALMLIFAIPSTLICVLLTFDHMFIHGGTYGVVFDPVNAVAETLVTKKPSVWERIKLSFTYFFTSFGAGLLVNYYVLVGVVIFFAICFAAISSIDLQTQNISQMGSSYVLIGLSIPIAAIYLVNYYITYDALYLFPYRSVDRLYAPNASAPRRWSLKFLSTCVLAFAIKVSLTFALTLFIQFLLDGFVLIDVLVYWVAYIIAAIVVEIGFLAFGAWGFVPVAKQPKSDVSGVKS